MPEPGLVAPHTPHSAGLKALTLDAAGAARSTGSVLAALTSAFDLAMHTVNLSEDVFGLGLHL